MHRALSAVLYAISAIQAVAAIVLLLAPRWLLTMTHVNYDPASGGLYVAFLMALGLVVLALCYLTYCAARDPGRYVGVINALIFLALGAATLNIYTVVALHVPGSYIEYLLTRSAIQAVFAVVLLLLHPRKAAVDGGWTAPAATK